MRAYLLDTNVVSEPRKTKPHGAVIAWLQSVPEASLRIPAIVIGELQDGAELTRLQNPAKALELEHWIDHILATFNVIPMDGILFREWSRLMVGKSDHLTPDAMIAATARIHHMVVVTRNTKDFEPFGVEIFNPFTYRQKDSD